MKLSERIRRGHDISGNLADTAEVLERNLDNERIRCMDLAARLDRARMELRAAEAARDEARATVENGFRMLSSEWRARAERAEEKLRRVKEAALHYARDSGHVYAFSAGERILRIIEEESGR